MNASELNVRVIPNASRHDLYEFQPPTKPLQACGHCESVAN